MTVRRLNEENGRAPVEKKFLVDISFTVNLPLTIKAEDEVTAQYIAGDLRMALEDYPFESVGQFVIDDSWEDVELREGTEVLSGGDIKVKRA